MTPAEIRAAAELAEAEMPAPTPRQLDALAALLRPRTERAA